MCGEGGEGQGGGEGGVGEMRAGRCRGGGARGRCRGWRKGEGEGWKVVSKQRKKNSLHVSSAKSAQLLASLPTHCLPKQL